MRYPAVKADFQTKRPRALSELSFPLLVDCFVFLLLPVPLEIFKGCRGQRIRAVTNQEIQSTKYTTFSAKEAEQTRSEWQADQTTQRVPSLKFAVRVPRWWPRVLCGGLAEGRNYAAYMEMP